MIPNIKRVMKIKLNLVESIKNCDLGTLFGVDLAKEQWVWLNAEIFPDLIMNITDYDSYDEEEELMEAISELSEGEFINIVANKMKEIDWMLVNQYLFEKLEEGFNVTEDIKTYILVEKKYFMIKMIGKLKELEWVLKAMAVDSFQHLTPERTLKSVYEEDFHENMMILENIMISGKYEKSNCVWRVVSETQSLVFYKNEKQYRVWAEGNANFIFGELNK